MVKWSPAVLILTLQLGTVTALVQLHVSRPRPQRQRRYSCTTLVIVHINSSLFHGTGPYSWIRTSQQVPCMFGASSDTPYGFGGAEVLALTSRDEIFCTAHARSRTHLVTLPSSHTVETGKIVALQFIKDSINDHETIQRPIGHGTGQRRQLTR